MANADPRNQILVHQLGDLPALAHLPQISTAIGRSPFRTSKLRQAVAEKKNSPDAVTEPKQHSVVGPRTSIVSSFAGSPMAISSPIVASHRQSLSQMDITPVVASATPQSNRGGLVPMQVDTAASLRGLPDTPDSEPPSATGSASIEQAAGNGPSDAFAAPPEAVPASAHAEAEMARYLADGYEDNVPPETANRFIPYRRRPFLSSTPPRSISSSPSSRSSSRTSSVGSPMQITTPSRRSSFNYAMDIDIAPAAEPSMSLRYL